MVWGSTFIGLKYLLGKFQPLELLITRFTISFLLLWMLEPKRMKSTWKDERLFFLAGLSGIAGYYTLEALALEISQSSNVGVLVSISPLMTALLARLILKERLPKGFFVGCIILVFNSTFICKASNFLDKDDDWFQPDPDSLLQHETCLGHRP